MRPSPLSAIVPICLLLGWEVATRTGTLDPRIFSQPTAIVAAIAEAARDGSLIQATRETLEAAVVGLVLGFVFGVALGILLGLRTGLEVAARPTTEMLRSIPAIAFTPLALLLLGFGLSMEVAIVAYACCWPIFIATLTAVRNIDPRLLEIASVLEMSPQRRLRTIIAPAVFARVVVGLRTAIAFALVVAVTVEILSNPRGLGYALIVAQQTFRPDLMYALIVWLAILGAIFGGLSKLLDYTRIGRLA
ncbi:MAG: hypothetical protein BGP04_12495 [Rhizobiales bacterium 62-17]|nr:ABC transporter permease subunit [Hyphomicrobiales bacterium]OJY02137.1 MAG: hypothetical protein BGP04_12495 [Rhizobiales bacterium 62-17]